MSDERTPDVVTFTYETTVDYVVNLRTGEVKREDSGEIDGDPHYVALFCEGEFAGEYQLGPELPEGDDIQLVEQAEDLLAAAFDASAVKSIDTAITNIETRLKGVEEDYALIVPGVSDDSVLEAERDALEWALSQLRG